MQQPDAPLTYEQFLEFIENQDDGVTYEFDNGRAVAMSRPSTIHQRIVLAVAAALQVHLRGQRCDVYVDVRTWVGDGRDRVPDVAVTCDENDIDEALDVIHSPKLIIEVLSKNRGADLKTKIAEYEALPSMREYVVVDSRRRWLRRYHRKEAMVRFEVDPVRIAGSIILESVNYMLDIDALYRQVRFRDPTPRDD